MSYTERFTEVNLPAGVWYPIEKVPATYTSDWMLMSNYQRFIAVMLVGVIAAGGTVDLKLEQDDVGDGSNTKNISGKSITQLTQAGGDGDDLVGIELKTEEMDVDGGFKYVRLNLVVAVGNAFISALPLRFIANYPPVPTTVWEEIVD